MSDVSCEEVQALKTNLLLLLVQKWRLKEILKKKKKTKVVCCLDLNVVQYIINSHTDALSKIHAYPMKYYFCSGTCQARWGMKILKRLRPFFVLYYIYIYIYIYSFSFGFIDFIKGWTNDKLRLVEYNLEDWNMWSLFNR